MIGFSEFTNEIRICDKKINSLDTTQFSKNKLLYSKGVLELHFSECREQEYILLYRENTLLFYMVVTFVSNKKKFTLGLRENIFNEKFLLGKVIYTLLKLGFRVIEDFQMNVLNTKAIKRALDVGYIKIKYQNKIIYDGSDFDKMDDGQVLAYEYLDARTGIVLEEYKNSSLFDEGSFLEIN